MRTGVAQQQQQPQQYRAAVPDDSDSDDGTGSRRRSSSWLGVRRDAGTAAAAAGPSLLSPPSTRKVHGAAVSRSMGMQPLRMQGLDEAGELVLFLFVELLLHHSCCIVQ
jgi:hypothetical protein